MAISRGYWTRSLWPLVFGLLVLPASPRADAPVLNAQSLGVTESLLNYCSKVDPGDVANLQGKIAQLAQGASEETLASVRQSKEYRDAYETIRKLLSGASEEDAKSACSQSQVEGP